MIPGSSSMPVPRPILLFALVFAAFVYGDEARAESCAASSNRVTERFAGEHKGTQDLLVTGDFDGNGEPDRAFFAEIDGRISLVVCLHGHDRAFQLTEVSSVVNLGIQPADPGVYDHLCVRGVGPDCRPGEKLRWELDGPAIHFIDYERASSIFYWEGDRFERFWTSD